MKCAKFNDFYNFPLKCRFRGPRSADASVATRFLFILGGFGRAIGVKTGKCHPEQIINEKLVILPTFH